MIPNHQEIEQPKLPLDNDEQEKEQTGVTVHKENVLISVSSLRLSQQEPYVDPEGNRQCFWCHLQLRCMKLYIRPWLYCRDCNENSQVKEEEELFGQCDIGTTQEIKQEPSDPVDIPELIRDEKGYTYCPWCHNQIKN